MVNKVLCVRYIQQRSMFRFVCTISALSPELEWKPKPIAKAKQREVGSVIVLFFV